MYRPSQQVGNLYNCSRPEESSVAGAEDTGAYASFIVACPAAASAAQADYFNFENQAGDSFAAWLDIDADGTAPNGADYTAATTKIKVSILSTDTAAQVRTAVLAALGSVTDMTASSSGAASVLMTNDLIGTAVPAETHNAGDTTAGSFTVSAQAGGAASNLQSTYFTLSSPTVDYYVWFNVGGEGVDPAPGGTGIEVTLSAGDSDSDVATAIATAVDAIAAFAATANGALVSITDAVTGDATNIGAGNAGLTVTAITDGTVSGLVAPGSATDALKNEPDLI